MIYILYIFAGLLGCYLCFPLISLLFWLLKELVLASFEGISFVFGILVNVLISLAELVSFLVNIIFDALKYVGGGILKVLNAGPKGKLKIPEPKPWARRDE